MSTKKIVASALVAAALSTSAAQAGSYAPAVEAEPVVVVEQKPSSSFGSMPIALIIAVLLGVGLLAAGNT